MIVVDVGCARYGGDYSIERLIEEFCPDILYGFDPNVEGIRSALAQGEEVRAKCNTDVRIEATAAWIFDGEIGYVDDGLNSWITDRTEEMRVKCFDLARFIRELVGEPIYREQFDSGQGRPMVKAKRQGGVEGTFVETGEGPIRLEPIPEIVLKMDAEGSEYDLLSHLMMEGADELLKLAWVEWHSGPKRAEERRRTIEAEIACELAEWRW